MTVECSTRQGRTAQASAPIVSFDDEPLVLVDAADIELGFLDKASAHRGQGTLHRAFSIFIFNSRGEVLLQRRAEAKRLWPGYWSNACCSHPRRGESMESAVRRRLDEELGLVAVLRYLYKFEYHAQFDEDGAEHELCWVYAGQADAMPEVNPNEVAELRYIDPQALDGWINDQPETFTPWFKLEWARLRQDHSELWSRCGDAN
ncbi:isopentenyl-diphosphate Delta-isomerase [Frateuria aurantia]|uniref:Isopentenyl-diphosphate Delta-isomerase n=1 Tax=Frateuria aurantia (strain ATCC 33424 / DSM 6220 / KCTC 2777 / LMG 1558 / NBRC 3245 / NCIMB 13370) TaxID=767434 RepID=H8L1C0_FRAAD|nr:isopentenyl-diphosphate Delta-isomerase [Frateuria aurantia]AFC87528.1 isopentenyl-diphosphate delta-isomerase, type 1 [Frateuria aurantia DSM 6220]